jgi:hypothetical protein
MNSIQTNQGPAGNQCMFFGFDLSEINNSPSYIGVGNCNLIVEFKYIESSSLRANSVSRGHYLRH